MDMKKGMAPVRHPLAWPTPDQRRLTSLLLAGQGDDRLVEPFAAQEITAGESERHGGRLATLEHAVEREDIHAPTVRSAVAREAFHEAFTVDEQAPRLLAHEDIDEGIGGVTRAGDGSPDDSRARMRVEDA